MKHWKLTSIILGVTTMVGCQTYTPKPHGYPKIEFPTKSYERFNDSCAYSFEKPPYAVVEKDTHETADPCWYNIKFPQFGATIYLSYKEINSIEQLDSLSEDAFKLAGKHNQKADAIDENEFMSKDSVNRGLIFELFGPSATPFNFYLSDEKKHYLRGSFYFDYHTKTDSVAPVYEFLREDMMHMLNTLQWNNESI